MNKLQNKIIRTRKILREKQMSKQQKARSRHQKRIKQMTRNQKIVNRHQVIQKQQTRQTGKKIKVGRSMGVVVFGVLALS